MNSVTEKTPMRALLIDPSLFTPAYDAGLTRGLRAVGIAPHWAARPLRKGEHSEITVADIGITFYRGVEAIPAKWNKLRGLAKGLSHIVDLVRLVAHVHRRRPAVMHVQWAVLPLFDALAMRLVRRVCPVIMTVHDTVPFNGEKISFLQNSGFDMPIAAADHVIVHTRGARQNLIARGIAEGKVSIVPHGPLTLNVEPAPLAPGAIRDPRWTFVMFGQIKPYKGLDLLIEALGQLPPTLRQRARVVIAGAAHMDMAPISQRIAALGLEDVVELRLGRLDETQMASLFEEADSFLFPYRQIDASGVYFLLKPTGKWMIASDVGIFAEDMQEANGALVPPADANSLAAALADAIERRPEIRITAGGDWTSIGERTLEIYHEAMRQRGAVVAGLPSPARPSL
ncbi:glycosyltransferase [Rhizobium tumorigenes]|uniref:glycosyltransferase n=1 Tax=Rhizobium tumorigenes TaxID=2041385 RepID=UPI0024204ABB|nr:glycosyltransferase [Rhizobium tumorigenes]WFS01001.1 glycosyltransferase [Rhizobium tumorigenes]